MLKKITLLFITLLLIQGCSKEEGISNEIIFEKIKGKVSENTPLDHFNINKIKEVEITDEDIEGIRDTHPQAIPLYKYIVNIDYENIDEKAKGDILVIFKYYDNRWLIHSYKKTNDVSWKYLPKKPVSSGSIMRDLKNIEFEGFSNGYIGDEKITNIKIEEQNTSLEYGKDDIRAKVEVNTSYVNFSFDIDLKYGYGVGKWDLLTHNIQSPENWDVQHLNNEKPEFISKKELLNKITDETQFLTYVYNPNYVKEINLKDGVSKIIENGILHQYTLSTKYRDVGDINYDILIPYEWIGQNWIAGDIIIELSKYDISELEGEWTSDDKKMKIETAENDGTISGTINGKQFSGLLKVAIKDDNWNITINGEDNENILSLKDSTITINNNIYKKDKS